MTVKELIELLQAEDPDASVYRLAFDEEIEVEIVNIVKCENETGVLVI